MSQIPGLRPLSEIPGHTNLMLLVVAHDDDYDGVELQELYMAVLQVLVLEYANNIRFTAPTVVAAPTPPPMTPATPTKDSKLSSSTIKDLEERLRTIAVKQDTLVDDATRRSLLELYNKMLNPQFKQELATNRLTEYLFMSFIGCVQLALTKSQQPVTPAEKVRQADLFIAMLRGVTRGREDGVIAKMNDNRNLLVPSLTPLHARQKSDAGAVYTPPLYRVLDFNSPLLPYVQRVFGVDDVSLQQDIIAVKDHCLGKCMAADVKQAQFYLERDLGFWPPTKFSSPDGYLGWKQRQQQMMAAATKKYKVVPTLVVPLLTGRPLEYHMVPLRAAVLLYYIILLKLCIEATIEDASEEVLPTSAVDLVALVARVWWIDPTSRAVCLYTAAQLSGSMVDGGSSGEVINISRTQAVVHMCFQWLEDAQLDELPKSMWLIPDQDNWGKNLLISYNQTMYGVRDCLIEIFSPQKPKFGPFLSFLGEYLELDPLFASHVSSVGKTAVWEKKLAKSLVKTVHARYRELLLTLPRDDTVNIGHYVAIATALVDDINMIRKRYKHPLLGVLDVGDQVAQIYAKAFAKDAENILRHIDAYAKNKGIHIATSDAIDAYRATAEVRDIFRKLVSREKFLFNVEAFFFRYLEDWVAELEDKLATIVQNAIQSDLFAPIDLEVDDKKVSTLIGDVFKAIKLYVAIVRDLEWQDPYQEAKVYTVLLKAISDGSMAYANTLAEKIASDLDTGPADKTPAPPPAAVPLWFDDMKQAVAAIHKGETPQLPYQFHPATCIALNNLARVTTSLDKLDVDPELVLIEVTKRNPQAARQYLLHLVLIRLVGAENLALLLSAINPYVTMIDTKRRRTVAKLRPLTATANPEWDEEFELTLPPGHGGQTLLVTVWDKRLLNHAICGRALLALDPNRFGPIPLEVYLDLDTQGRVKLEILVELEQLDAVFVMGRAHRAVRRAQDRCIKLMVEKFSKFIHQCFLRANLKAVCANGRPSQQKMDDAMMPLYQYLNLGLEVLAGYLTQRLLRLVMVAAWNVVLATADALVLPNLVLAKTLHLLQAPLSSSWHAVSTTIANVTSTITGAKSLTTTEMDTVFSWLNFLCFDFFHNNGHGPPLRDLKNDHYQALLYIPNYYDADTTDLKLEVERLSPAYAQTLRDKNIIDGVVEQPKVVLRAQTMIRSNTIAANATARARAAAADDAQAARADPNAANAQMEDIILRILIARGEKRFVADRLAQREKLAQTIATERIIRAAAEGKLGGKRGRP